MIQFNESKEGDLSWWGSGETDVKTLTTAFNATILFTLS